MIQVIRFARVLISPAALCFWGILLCVGFSVAGSKASRSIVFRQENKFASAQASVPIQMKRWEEELFNRVSVRTKAEIAEFLKSAEQDTLNKSTDTDSGWRPPLQTVRYFEQFRTSTHVSYLEVMSVSSPRGAPTITFRTINYEKTTSRELTLGDLIEGAVDRSKAIEALSEYARVAIKDQIGEEEETDALSELTKPDLSIYSHFTFCQSARIGKAAGLTIHFAPETTGPYQGSPFHVTIPPTVFSKFLKPGMKSFFAGEPRQVPVVLDDPNDA